VIVFTLESSDVDAKILFVDGQRLQKGTPIQRPFSSGKEIKISASKDISSMISKKD
jgi:hypothetical protein